MRCKVYSHVKIECFKLATQKNKKQKKQCNNQKKASSKIYILSDLLSYILVVSSARAAKTLPCIMNCEQLVRICAKLFRRIRKSEAITETAME